MVTLDQLRDYAAAHPDESFPLFDCHACLGARCAGKPMVGYDKFRDGEEIAVPFAALLRSVGAFDSRGFRDGYGYFTGAQLVPALDELKQPDYYAAGVAERLCERAGARA